ncbi:hypothetical protein HAX54_035442 [Datura stramonium]|uniref:Uncharacterized protein n=1 Tax=Datura stramonium TaxID=4076 RepID=A0ABS8SG96_DATST|nr:hypothetical protein [Datura stramonium]
MEMKCFQGQQQPLRLMLQRMYQNPNLLHHCLFYEGSRILSMPETRARNQSIWRRPERFPISFLLRLKEGLIFWNLRSKLGSWSRTWNSNSIDVQRDATAELRLLAKHNMDNRIVMANCGSINLLVNLLHSEDMKAGVAVSRELMDPAAGMVDKAAAVLSNLASIHEEEQHWSGRRDSVLG